MGTAVLPQAFISVTPAPSRSTKLGFPVLCSLPSPLNSNQIPISRASLSHFSLGIVPCIIPKNKHSVVVKAELNSDKDTVAEEETAADGSEENVEETASDAEEEKPLTRKPRVKLGDIMGILNKQAIEASEKERPVPDIRTGDIVEIKLEVPENRRRASIYKGIVMSKQNAGIHTTIRIRRIIAGIGVEIVFPVYSPNIKEIKVIDHRKVRRARLYYLRHKLPRLSTFK